MNNRKGQNMMLFIFSIILIVTGIMGFIIAHSVFYGSAGSTGVFGIASTQFANETNSTAFTTVKNTWHLVPLAVVVGGVLFMIMALLQKEYQEYTYA